MSNTRARIIGGRADLLVFHALGYNSPAVAGGITPGIL